MKIIMIYDQIQSGAGIKDDHDIPLGAKKEAVGPAVMMEPFLKKVDGKVVACLYCGDGTYLKNPDEVSRKLCAMVNKLKPDVVMCGPCFNYLNYGKMAARIAYDINQNTSSKAIAAMSDDNQETINEYKDKLCIIKTPKKGGIGLNESLEGMCVLAKALYQEKEIEEILRTFDKAPSPSSENSVQNQAQQNNKQPRQISQKPTDTERTARTSNQTEYKRQAQSSKMDIWFENK